MRNGLIGQVAQLGLLGDDLIRGQSLDQIGLVVCVLNNCNTAQDGAVLQDGQSVFLDQLMHDPGALVMDALRPVLLAQADGHHLHQAALIAAAERGMRLDPVEQDDAIRLFQLVEDFPEIVFAMDTIQLPTAGPASLTGAQ